MAYLPSLAEDLPDCGFPDDTVEMVTATGPDGKARVGRRRSGVFERLESCDRRTGAGYTPTGELLTSFTVTMGRAQRDTEHDVAALSAHQRDQNGDQVLWPAWPLTAVDDIVRQLACCRRTPSRRREISSTTTPVPVAPASQAGRRPARPAGLRATMHRRPAQATPRAWADRGAGRRMVAVAARLPARSKSIVNSATRPTGCRRLPTRQTEVGQYSTTATAS